MVYALSRIGATANMIDVRYPAKGIEEQIDMVGSKMLFAYEGIASNLASVFTNTATEEVVLVSASDSIKPISIFKNAMVRTEFLKGLTSGRAKAPIPFTRWKDFLERDADLNGLVFVPDTPVVAMSTGGTTGTPKKVLLTNENINAAVSQVSNMGFNIQSNHSWYDIMPPFIAYGLADGLHWPLSVGAEVYLVPNPNAIDFGAEILKHKPNHIAGAANHWESLLANEQVKDADLSFLIDPICGGDAVNPKTEIAIDDFLQNHNCGDLLKVGYGMTECSGAASVAPTNELKISFSVGYPVPSSKVAAFVKKDGRWVEQSSAIGDEDTVDEKSIGEICITGPHVMQGYLNNPTETDKVLIKHDDGRIWLHSGDAGYIGSKGEVYITGRYKDFIVSYTGFKIPPKEIEDVIAKHPHVRKVKAVGYPDESYSQGELACAFVVLDEGCDVPWEQVESEIRELCAAELPDYKQPARYERIDALPLTPIGKVDVKALRKSLISAIQQQFEPRGV